ncbi:hypothetical protein [Peribacillus frigoritolerans]|nr:hypothetical protein [Peribacillus castrilensis]
MNSLFFINEKKWQAFFKNDQFTGRNLFAMWRSEEGQPKLASGTV